MSDSIYVYVQYKTPLGRKGTYATKLSVNRIVEAGSAQLTITTDERNTFIQDAINCIAQLDAGVASDKLFSNSALSPELLSSFLLASSANLMRVVQHCRAAPDNSVHAVYAIFKNDDNRNVVTETIYPGPDSLAPDEALEAWLDAQSFGS